MKNIKSREYRLFGPPGTGKTTWIAKKATEYAERFGSDQVSLCSLTNTAIGEVAGRDIPIDRDNISTLHARCKRALQAPAPAESMVKDFIEKHPQWATRDGMNPCLPRSLGARSGRDKDVDTVDTVMSGGGISLYEQAQILRQRMVPKADWPSEVRQWFSVWNSWCREIGHLDFTGWLEEALEVRPLPYQQVVFVDEAQDHTPLQLAVIRSWNTRIRILVGDDDQNLYEWSGAVPRAFFSNEECVADGEMVLEQSYRVPRAVHETAVAWTSRIRDRRDKKYYPKDVEGSVKRISYRIDDAEFGGELPPGLLENEEETYMILASCTYMLNSITDPLKRKRVPFHNPYRSGDPKWNPMVNPGKRVSSYLAGKDEGRLWTGVEAYQWAEVLKAKGVFRSRMRTEFLERCDFAGADEILEKDIRACFEESVADRVLKRDIGVLRECRKIGVPGSWDYALDIIEREGEIPEPRLIVGTIHSVKGGEADNVYLFPDLSPSGFLDYTGANSDRVYRLFYVGMTRAKKNLYLCQQNQPRAVLWM